MKLHDKFSINQPSHLAEDINLSDSRLGIKELLDSLNDPQPPKDQYELNAVEGKLGRASRALKNPACTGELREQLELVTEVLLSQIHNYRPRP